MESGDRNGDLRARQLGGGRYGADESNALRYQSWLDHNAELRQRTEEQDRHQCCYGAPMIFLRSPQAGFAMNAQQVERQYQLVKLQVRWPAARNQEFSVTLFMSATRRVIWPLREYSLSTRVRAFRERRSLNSGLSINSFILAARATWSPA